MRNQIDALLQLAPPTLYILRCIKYQNFDYYKLTESEQEEYVKLKMLEYDKLSIEQKRALTYDLINVVVNTIFSRKDLETIYDYIQKK